MAALESVSLRAIVAAPTEEGLRRLEGVLTGDRSLVVASLEEVVALLDEGSLRTLRTENGKSMRALAIEAVLNAGYPHALRLHPDELEWYRGHVRSGVVFNVLILLGVLAVGVASAIAWWFLSTTS